MSSTMHTPAPWDIVRYGDGDSLVIHSDSESRICFMATPGSMGDPEKIAADASLIAAAPDMFNALQLIASHIQSLPRSATADAIHASATAAIKKATANA